MHPQRIGPRTSRPSPRFLVTGVALAWIAFAPARPAHAAVEVSSHDEAPPDLLVSTVKDRLAAGGARVTLEDVTLDFWWVSALPLADAGGEAIDWGQTDEGSLVGAVRLSDSFPDIRGRVISPGVYTLRFARQPANGDHLGVSPYREFLLLVPAADDTEPEPGGHDRTVELSAKSTGLAHPGVLSLHPPVSTAELLSVEETPDGHDAVTFEVPVTRKGEPSGTLRFGLIVVGRIEA